MTSLQRRYILNIVNPTQWKSVSGCSWLLTLLTISSVFVSWSGVFYFSEYSFYLCIVRLLKHFEDCVPLPLVTFLWPYSIWCISLPIQYRIWLSVVLLVKNIFWFIFPRLQRFKKEKTFHENNFNEEICVSQNQWLMFGIYLFIYLFSVNVHLIPYCSKIIFLVSFWTILMV